MARKLQSWVPASDPDVLAVVAWDDEDPDVPQECIALTRGGVAVDDPAAEYARLITLNTTGE